MTRTQRTRIKRTSARAGINTLVACILFALALDASSPIAQANPQNQTTAIVAAKSITQAAIGQLGALSALQRRPKDADPTRWHTPDPGNAAEYIEKELQKDGLRRLERKFGESLLKRLRTIQRPEKVSLSLQEAIHRAVANNHAVRVESYNPGINTARIVEAEAAFDGIFFSNMLKNVVDRPTASQLGASNIDIFTLNNGVRKLLPTGTEVTTTLKLQRQFIDLIFQQLNPEYTSQLIIEFRQPLLRGAGIDFNRAQIDIAQNNFRISRQTFKRSLRELVFGVERAYWRLAQARREVAIRARILTEFEQTYDYLQERRDFDVYPIQLAQTKANIETSKGDFIGTINTLQRAEDALIVLMNDPSINLTDDFEIHTSDFPSTSIVEINRHAEIRAALENRAEILESRIAIENAAVAVGQSKNLTMPQFDFTFRYTVDGLGESMDDAFDQVTQNDYSEYFFQLDLQVPIGNRAAKAVLRRAQLTQAQSIANLKRQIEQVIIEVNTASRDIRAEFDRIEPFLQSAEANEDQISAIIARAERKDFTALNQELNARRDLANSRSQLLDALTRYNVALIELERSKGTILDFNNIHIAEPGEDSHVTTGPAATTVPAVSIKPAENTGQTGSAGRAESAGQAESSTGLEAGK